MPALGWQSPDRKPHKLNIPVDDRLKERLEALAVRMGVRKTELARDILTKFLENVE